VGPILRLRENFPSKLLRFAKPLKKDKAPAIGGGTLPSPPRPELCHRCGLRIPEEAADQCPILSDIGYCSIEGTLVFREERPQLSRSAVVLSEEAAKQDLRRWRREQINHGPIQDPGSPSVF
jgi:hypothetical protein